MLYTQYKDVQEVCKHVSHINYYVAKNLHYVYKLGIDVIVYIIYINNINMLLLYYKADIKLVKHVYYIHKYAIIIV